MFNKKNSKYISEKLDWKEAIQKGVKILVNNKIANENLYDAILNITNKFGAYYVLEKGIALVHAPIGNYNLKPGVSLILLKENIQFNNQDKWAKIIITLSAIDKVSHIEFIKCFGNVFSNIDVKNQLLNANSLNEFIEIFNKKGGTNGN